MCPLWTAGLFLLGASVSLGSLFLSKGDAIAGMRGHPNPNGSGSYIIVLHLGPASFVTDSAMGMSATIRPNRWGAGRGYVQLPTAIDNFTLVDPVSLQTIGAPRRFWLAPKGMGFKGATVAFMASPTRLEAWSLHFGWFVALGAATLSLASVRVWQGVRREKRAAVACVHCRYNLQGLAPGAPCPECGALP